MGQSPIAIDPGDLDVLVSTESVGAARRAHPRRLIALAAACVGAVFVLTTLVPESLGDRPYDPRPSRWVAKVIHLQPKPAIGPQRTKLQVILRQGGMRVV